MTEGLTREEAKERLEKYGPNEVKEEEGTTLLDILKRQVENILVLILIAAALISFFTGEMLEFYFIIFIIGLIVFLGAVQEWKAEKAMEKLKELSEPTASVVREGEVFEIPRKKVVPGDILKLHTGDKISADAEVIKSTDMKVDEAVMTGESETVSKKKGDELFSGTTIVHGKGEAEVTKTGMDTELGKIASEIQQKERETPLQRRINDLGKTLGIVAVIATASILVLGIVIGAEFVSVLLVALALTVASIPEGLPLALTLTLSMGVRDLAKKNAIVRKMLAVEGLGSTTVICTDKTGTLTRNEMTVEKVYILDQEFEVTGAGYSPEGEIIDREGNEIDIENHTALDLLLDVGMVCNDAELVHKEGEYKIRGSPTEGALITLGEKAGGKREEVIRDEYPRLDEIPFSSDRKMMTTVNRSPADEEKIVFVKGAPEVILERCSSVLIHDEKKEISDSVKKDIQQQTKKYTENAMRVLAMAYKRDMEGNIEDDLTFLGVVAMRDPPRKGVKETIEKCKHAGIEVKMVTGDNPTTAKAIAKKIGLSEEAKVLTGSDLDDMSDEELSDILEEVDIYARTMPGHKNRLVKAYQSKDEIVAMTGDGINDAPAVKRADVGVGMGVKGTDVTKEASDVILQDDNFSTLVTAVENGRRIYDNIEKFTTYLVSRNFTEITVIALGIIAFLDFDKLPLLALQVLFLNVIGQEMPAIALGLDPAHELIMERSPKRTGLNILHRRNMYFIVPMAIYMAVSSFLAYYYVLPQGSELARTVVFSAITIMIMVNQFNFKSLENNLTEINWWENKLLWISLGLIGIVLLTLVYHPLLAEIFEHEPLRLKHWGLVLSVGLSTIPVIEILKKITNTKMDTSYMWKR